MFSQGCTISDQVQLKIFLTKSKGTLKFVCYKQISLLHIWNKKML